KSFAKEVLAAAGVPTATTLTDPRPPCVVKADGLAAGKGVFVCTTQEELDAGLAAAAALGGPLVVEERLEGVELSVFALTDGSRALPLAAARRAGRGRARRPDPPAGARRARRPPDALPRVALRRADADRRRPSGARVQLPVRRPGDPGDSAAARRRSARGARGGSRRRPPRCDRRLDRRCRGHRRPRGG